MKLNLSRSGSQTKDDFSPLSVTLSKRKLLVVDDEKILLTVLTDIFEPHYDVQTAESGEEALELLTKGWKPEVIIADQRMSGMSGAQFLAQSIEHAPAAVRVILTGYTDVQDIIDSINLGNVYRFMTKPWQRDELLEAVRLCFEHFDLASRNLELAEALKKLKELDEEKDEFLGIVAHDLKNPLQVIREYAQMCSEELEMPTDMRTRMLQSIVRTSNRMFAIIRNLLDINALERGAMNVQLVRFSLAAASEYVIKDYESPAHAKNITLQLRTVSDTTVFADESLTIQVIENLLSNAIKYSPPNTNVFLTLTHPTPHRVRLAVKDEGPGISEADMKKLFGKFSRLTARPTGGEDSTGLGLSIVKKIVEFMHGSVWCESTQGNGATFVIELPTSP